MSEESGQIILVHWADETAAVVSIVDMGGLTKSYEDYDHWRTDAGYGSRAYVADSKTGNLVPLQLKVKRTGFDEDGWAYVDLAATFPDGHVETSSYRVDGRA